MPISLAAIRVQILLKFDGGRQVHDYPNFNLLPAVIASGMDWSVYVDVQGRGWHYDHIGHHEEAPDSPLGQQLGMLLVPAQFALEAVAMFPTRVMRLSEAQTATFYNDRAHAHEPEIFLDADVLRGIELRRTLAPGIPPQDEINALDPDHPSPGRRRNRRRFWADLKTLEAITFIP